MLVFEFDNDRVGHESGLLLQIYLDTSYNLIV